MVSINADIDQFVLLTALCSHYFKYEVITIPKEVFNLIQLTEINIIISKKGRKANYPYLVKGIANLRCIEDIYTQIGDDSYLTLADDLRKNKHIQHRNSIKKIRFNYSSLLY